MWVTNVDILEANEIRGNITAGAGTVWTTELANEAVTKSKVSYELKTITITDAASWTATVVTGWQIMGWYVSAITWTAFVKSVVISSTTLTVTLSASDTATVNVMVLKA